MEMVTLKNDYRPKNPKKVAYHQIFMGEKNLLFIKFFCNENKIIFLWFFAGGLYDGFGTKYGS